MGHTQLFVGAHDISFFVCLPETNYDLATMQEDKFWSSNEI
jgi:hypothetical protein